MTEDPEETSLKKRVWNYLNLHQMKRRHFFLITTVVVFLFSSCSKKDTINPVQNKQLNAKDFEIYGKAHNKQMHDVYLALSSSKSTALNINVRSTGINGAMQMISVSQALSTSDSVLIYDLDNTPGVSTLEKELGTYSINSTFAGTPIMDDSHLYTTAVASNLTSSQIGLLDELEVVMDNIDTDNNLSVTESKIDAIENEVPGLNLTESQQSVLYIATNVAKSSISYWNDEGPLWEQLKPTQNSVISQSPRATTFGFWRSIWGGIKQAAKGDVAGAVGGAVTCAAVNIIVGPGTLAYGASIVGASAGGSAYEAVMYCLQ